MSRKVIVILITLAIFSFAQQDSLQRLSAIATGGYPWDNKADGIYDYLADRGALAIIDISDSTSPILTFRTSGTSMWSCGVEITDTLTFVNHLGTTFWIGRLSPLIP